jgi:TatD DNase family protein
MLFVETHSHLDFDEFDADREEVIKRALDAGVRILINVGASLDSSKRAVELAHKYPCIFAAVSVHPHDSHTVDDKVLAEIDELASDLRVVAIGETGLDFYRNLSPQEVQKRVFLDFIAIAKKHNKPLIVHSRDSTSEAISVIAETKPTAGGVFHCYSSSVENAKRIFQLGFLVSVAGNITFSNAEKLRSKIAQLPIENLMLETDSPYLAPQQYRGKRCEPAYIPLVASEVARLHALSIETVAEITTKNAKRVFRISEDVH